MDDAVLHESNPGSTSFVREVVDGTVRAYPTAANEDVIEMFLKYCHDKKVPMDPERLRDLAIERLAELDEFCDRNRAEQARILEYDFISSEEIIERANEGEAFVMTTASMQFGMADLANESSLLRQVDNYIQSNNSGTIEGLIHEMKLSSDDENIARIRFETKSAAMDFDDESDDTDDEDWS